MSFIVALVRLLRKGVQKKPALSRVKLHSYFYKYNSFLYFNLFIPTLIILVVHR